MSFTTASARSGFWNIYASLYLVSQRSGVLDLMTASDILALMKLQISEYPCFSLLLTSEARRHYAAIVFIHATLRIFLEVFFFLLLLHFCQILHRRLAQVEACIYVYNSYVKKSGGNLLLEAMDIYIQL